MSKWALDNMTDLKLPHMKLLNTRSSSIFVRIKCRQSLTYFDIIKSTAKNKFILLTSIFKTSLFQVEIRNEPRTNIGTWRSILGMTPIGPDRPGCPERSNRKLIHLKFIDQEVATFLKIVCFSGLYTFNRKIVPFCWYVLIVNTVTQGSYRKTRLVL